MKYFSQLILEVVFRKNHVQLKFMYFEQVADFSKNKYRGNLPLHPILLLNILAFRSKQLFFIDFFKNIFANQ